MGGGMPPKPAAMRAGHMTKAERETREKAEAALTVGVPMAKWPSTRKNRFASKQFDRLSKAFAKIGQNDTIHEAALNRYCVILGECDELEQRRPALLAALAKTDEAWARLCGDREPETADVLNYARAVAAVNGELNRVDGVLGSKRNALLQIEKENIMSVLGKLRAVPKKPPEDAEEADPMAQRLAGITDIRDRKRMMAGV